MSKQHRRYLYFVVLVGGMTTLAFELAASRLLGAYFGTGNVVWASIIGLILIYLSAGYFLGGRWADRSPYPTTLYLIALWGAFLGGLIPFVARIVLPALASLQLPLAAATLTAIVVLFAVPVILLGCISPFAIRLLLEHVSEVGQTSGRLYAVSTLGSVIGALAPVLYLLPTAGTTATFLIFADVLLVTALVGLLANAPKQSLLFSWMPAAHLLLWITL